MEEKTLNFINDLEKDFVSSKNINVAVNKQKGLITVLWSSTFSDLSNLEYYYQNIDEIEWANSKLEYLAEKYSQYLVNVKVLNESDAFHFDTIYLTTKQRPVKRELITNTQSFGGYVQFKV